MPHCWMAAPLPVPFVTQMLQINVPWMHEVTAMNHFVQAIGVR